MVCRTVVPTAALPVVKPGQRETHAAAETAGEEVIAETEETAGEEKIATPGTLTAEATEEPTAGTEKETETGLVAMVAETAMMVAVTPEESQTLTGTGSVRVVIAGTVALLLVAAVREALVLARAEVGAVPRPAARHASRTLRNLTETAERAARRLPRCVARL